MRHKVLLKRLLFFIAVCAMTFTGCKSAEQSQSAAELNQPPLKFQSLPIDGHDVELVDGQESAPRDYAFSPGDTVEVKFFYTPELNETQDVRPDGKIALQIIGEVSVTGKTPAQLRWLLEKLYTSHLKDPEISVVVRSFSNQRIYVGGQVMRPGTVEMTDQMTALEAIMQVGGVDFREGQARKVVVIRHDEGTRYGYMLDMEPILKGQKARPFFLEAKDIVYVPRTDIAKINQWIDQYINKIIPETGFTFARRRGDTVIGVDMTGSY